MKPEVGMFYRYKGQIGKYKKITELDRYPSFTNNYLRKNEVILLNNAKFSYNIIDLIEVGDYVNGELVEYIEVNSYKDYVINSGYWCKQENIKSIVTKEMFSSVEYRMETN